VEDSEARDSEAKGQEMTYGDLYGMVFVLVMSGVLCIWWCLAIYRWARKGDKK